MIVRIPLHRTEHGSARAHEPAAPATPRPGAPNVLYIVWDEAGIGTWSAFGGLAETPTMKWLAGRGLRYSQWHTNALPSPTHCCLLTGRYGEPEGSALDQGAIIPQEAGTLAEILGRNGYRSYCVGQWHHSPQPGALSAEPCGAPTARQTWPLGRGFDRYYGFLDRRTSPWYPDLVYDNRHVDPPYAPDDGYHLTRDLVDMAVEFLRDGAVSGSRQPWFCYLSLGAGGAQATPQEWADMYRGRFDMGYDRYRDVVLGNMKRLGIVPKSTVLAPTDAHPARGPAAESFLVRRWRSLTDGQRRRSSRLAESAAGSCSYTDHEVGRLLRYLEESGQLDDTIVVVCSAKAMSAGDRSPAAGGPGRPAGSLSENDLLAGWPGPDQATKLSAADGGDAGECAAGWAWAFATPYNMLRQDSLGGSAASPLIISWPREMDRVAGGVRDQYHHAVDIVPTILDCAGIDPPQTIKAHVQRPLHGVSMRYTFRTPEAPSARQTQLYQMPGAGAIYHGGWKAVAGDGPAGARRWELYRVSADRAETRNVAARYPEKVAELASLWEAAAGRPGGPARERRGTPEPLAQASRALTGRMSAH
jgi:arylsulfatase